MSSATGLNRTRSLRQPTTSRTQSTQKDGEATRGTGRTVSPSRLPQVKPLTRSATTTTAPSASAAARSRAASNAAATAATSTATTASGRPLSGIFSGKPGATTTRRRSPTATETAPSSRPLGRAPSVRQTTSQQTPGEAKRKVSATATRPTSSSGLPSPSAPPKPRVLGHARAKSTATATTLTAATTLRPPTSNTPSVHSRPSPGATAVPSTPTRATTTVRSHARNTSRSTTGTTSHAAAAAAPAPLHRPAFNTNQQYYSPLKSHALKPLTSTYLAPPSPSKLPSNVAISAETSRLQTELLQLSLIHREAGAITRQWHESARRKLGDRFRQVAIEHENMCAEERAGTEARNVAALLRWGTGGAMGLEEKIQALDQVLDGVWAFSEPAGRYSKVVDGFECWASRMADIMTARKSGKVEDLVNGPETLFVSDLDTEWKDGCAGLVRKLGGWKGILDEIGPAPSEDDGSQKSSLSRILGDCASMVDDMLAELELMQEIEQEARRAEDQWIEKMNDELKIGDHETMDNEAPLWKLII